MNGKNRPGKPALNHIIGVQGYNSNACRESFVSSEHGCYTENSNTLQETECNKTIEYNNTNPDESYVNYLSKLAQRLQVFFKRNSETKERDATALNIDFFRDCFGNYSLTSTQCPFCPQGLYCKRSVGNNSFASQEEI
jgi:hypothetical protein